MVSNITNKIICLKSIRQSEFEQITETLMNYIEGTANGEPERLKEAFHPDFNLYTVTQQDSLRVRSGEKYIAGINRR